METLIEEPPAKARRVLRRYSPPILVTVILFHLVFGGVAAIWVVSRYSAARKLTFNAGPKSPNPSERALARVGRFRAGVKGELARGGISRDDPDGRDPAENEMEKDDRDQDRRRITAQDAAGFSGRFFDQRFHTESVILS